MSWWRACLVAIAIGAAVVSSRILFVPFSVDVPPITVTTTFPGTDNPPVSEVRPGTTRSCRYAMAERLEIDTEDGRDCLDGATHRIRIAELVLAVPVLGALGTYVVNFVRRRRSQSTQPGDAEPVSFAAGVVAGVAVSGLAWLIAAVDVSGLVVTAVFAVIVLGLIRARAYRVAAGVSVGTALGLLAVGLWALSQ